MSGCGYLIHIRQASVRGAGQIFDGHSHCFRVRRHLHGDLLDGNAFSWHPVREQAVHADPFAEPFRDHFLPVHIEQLVFQGRTSRIDDENVHKRYLLDNYILDNYNTS